jgi:glycosyltransferase involved in cell wall biosynthesis
VAAAKIVREKGVNARFVLVGDSDPDNFSCIPREKLLEWQSSGVVEWWGHQQDMQKALTQANLVCLPSRGGEGVPKALLEAAACGRAIVATDVPGCRDIVRDGVSGLLVPARNPLALAEAIQKMLNSPEARAQMALRCREIAVKEFSQEVVAQQTLELYRRLLNSP